MDKEKLSEIIECYIWMYSDNLSINLERLSEIYVILGEKLEDYDKEKAQSYSFFIDKLRKITNQIINMLDEEEKQYFLDEIPEVISDFILTDDEKMAKLDDITNIKQKIDVICTIQDDDKKISQLENVKDEYNRATIITSLQDDDKKISQLEKIKREFNRARIIESLQDDDKKISQLENIKEEYNRGIIIESLQDDDKKIGQLEKIKEEYNREIIIESLQNNYKKIGQLEKNEEEFSTRIIESLQDDDKKIGQLVNIKYEENRKIIIESIQNDDKKISQLENVKDEYNRATIITSLQDDDKKISQLEKIKREFDRARIIESLQDDDKKIGQLVNIESEKNRTIIIASIKDDDKKIGQLVNIKNEENREIIIESIQDVYKKIGQLEKIENEYIRVYIIESIIESLADDDKKISLLEKIKDKSIKLYIIETISDDKKRMCELGKIDEKAAIVYRAIYENGGSSKEEYKYKTLGIPSKMTVGIEIEAEGECGEYLPEKIDCWIVKADGSLSSNGIECVSPIMNDNLEFVSQIYKINQIMQASNMKISNRCGGHVHIGADYITIEQGFKELVELWGNVEEIYFLISNKPGELPREGVEEYASSISENFQNTSLENIPKDEFVEDVKNVLRNDRYKSLNLMNVNNGKNTIEFRLSNGTLDADTWIENIRLYGRTVELASKLRRNCRKERK